MTSLVPGIAHRFQLCQYVEVRSFLWESRAQYGTYLHDKLSHQDVPSIIEKVLGITADVPGVVADILSITTDVLGVVTDVLGIAMDVLGIVSDFLGFVMDVLGVIIDFPRPLVHPLLYRNLAGRSVRTTVGLVTRTW